MAHLTSIVYKPADVERRPAGRFSRVPLNRAVLVAGHGIDGDTKGRFEGRELNVMRAEAVEQLKAEGFFTAPGQLGEQLVIAGLPADALADGARLRLGDAVIEVVKGRTPCTRFAEIQGKTVKQAWGRLGVMARVVAGGAVAVGDAVTLEHERAAS